MNGFLTFEVVKLGKLYHVQHFDHFYRVKEKMCTYAGRSASNW